MYRINTRSCSKLACGAALALCASFAHADDSSMSVLTGDSYAFFNNLDYNPGKFNTAKAPANEGDSAVAKAGKDTDKDPGKAEKGRTSPRPSAAASSVFRNDTGA